MALLVVFVVIVIKFLWQWGRDGFINRWRQIEDHTVDIAVLKKNDEVQDRRLDHLEEHDGQRNQSKD